MFHELLRRRVPQALIGYFVAGWGVIQFVQFLEARYRLSPAWVDLLGVGILALVPALVVFAWSQGAPGRDRWTRPQRAALAATLGLALVAAGTAAARLDFAGRTTTVEVADENGDRVRREIARQDFRLSLSSSFPRAEGLVDEDRWWSTAVLVLLESALADEAFVETRSAWTALPAVARAGIDDPRDAPRALVLEVARRQNARLVLVSTLGGSAERMELGLQVFEVRGEKLLGEAEFTFAGGEIFGTVDAASAWIRSTLQLPDLDRGEEAPRSVSDQYTSSVPALREMVVGLFARAVENDEATAVEHLRRAVEIDPTFAAAHLQLYAALAFAGRGDEALAAVDEAMRHSYRLTERDRFLTRASYYAARNETPKAMAVLRMWAQLRPDDPLVHRLLATNLSITGDRRGAIAGIERLLELVPDDVEGLRALKLLSLEEGDLDRAERTAERLVELQPGVAQGLLDLAEVQVQAARLEAAAATLERAELVAPGDAQVGLERAQLARRRGEYELAMEVLDEVIASSPSDADRERALSWRLRCLRDLGRLDAAVGVLGQWEATAAEVFPVVQLAVVRAAQADLIAEAGDVDGAYARIESIRSALQPPLSDFISLGEIGVAIHAEDADRARNALAVLDRAVRSVGVESLRPRLHALRAQLARLEGRHDDAVAHADSALALDRSLESVLVHRATALRSAGRLGEALAGVDDYLSRQPGSPEGRWERAQVLAALGRAAEAREDLLGCLALWEGADPDFERAIEARALLDGLRTQP